MKVLRRTGSTVRAEGTSTWPTLSTRPVWTTPKVARRGCAASVAAAGRARQSNFARGRHARRRPRGAQNERPDALAAASPPVHSGVDGDASPSAWERTYPAGPRRRLGTPHHARPARPVFLPVSGDRGSRRTVPPRATPTARSWRAKPPSPPGGQLGRAGQHRTVDLARLLGDDGTGPWPEHAVPATYGDAGGALLRRPWWTARCCPWGTWRAGRSTTRTRSPEMLSRSTSVGVAWEAAVRVRHATEEQVAAAVEVSLQQFTVLPEQS
ncbi:hypothetical protein HBB16_17845 [Pseudonocardia sp. MCCB 268]|nr:hypothetical protein [Pseudonocardia cytotoxica]